MQIVRIKNKIEYIQLVKFLYKEEHFGCIEDWDYFFDLNIFPIRENEGWEDYMKRMYDLEKKDDKQVVREYNGKTGNLPDDSMFPCIAIYEFGSQHDRFGRVDCQIFHMIPEKDAKTIYELTGQGKNKTRSSNGQNRNINDKKVSSHRYGSRVGRSSQQNPSSNKNRSDGRGAVRSGGS